MLSVHGVGDTGRKKVFASQVRLQRVVSSRSPPLTSFLFDTLSDRGSHTEKHPRLQIQSDQRSFHLSREEVHVGLEFGDHRFVLSSFLSLVVSLADRSSSSQPSARTGSSLTTKKTKSSEPSTASKATESFTTTARSLDVTSE